MESSTRPLSRIVIPLIVLIASSCSSPPTYPKAHLANSLQELLNEDHLQASVRLIDHTLAVHLMYPNVLVQTNGQVGLGPAFDEATRKVITAMHRVILSTDADIAFYVLLLSDPAIPGAYVTLVRYLDDVKRANANMLDTPELFARTIFELNMGPKTLTLEQYVPRDIRLEEFLSWQLSRRIQYALMEQLQTSGAAEVGRCGGEFHDGEFAFTLDVAPRGGKGPFDEATMQQMFQTSTNVIAKVLSSYRFESFNAVRLIHPLTGRNIVLPKTRLDVFR